MDWFQTLLYGCKAQLAHSNIKYEDIDYGFIYDSRLLLQFHTWPIAGRVFFILAWIIFSLILYPIGIFARAYMQHMLR
jgi:hypothetical protein